MGVWASQGKRPRGIGTGVAKADSGSRTGHGGRCGLVPLCGSHSAGEGGFTPTGQGSLWAPLEEGSGEPFTSSGQDSLLALEGIEAQGNQNRLAPDPY